MRCNKNGGDIQVKELVQSNSQGYAGISVFEDEVLLRVDEKAIDGNLLESASDLIRQREACLDKGISLSATLVMRLKDLMMDSFVPESDQSRSSGAGPG